MKDHDCTTCAYYHKLHDFNGKIYRCLSDGLCYDTGEEVFIASICKQYKRTLL